METVAVPAPAFEVKLNGKDVTRDLSPFILSITYEDHEEGESDSVDLSLEDVDGRFRDKWYPEKGMKLHVKLGYAGAALLDCGEFDLDEIGLNGLPDTVSLKGVAAGVKQAHRTKHAKAYEATTLGGIAKAVASRHKLKLVGEVEDIQIRRVTQLHETDLAFLKRVSGEYGYAFSVKGQQLVFFKRAALAAGKSVLTLRRSDIRPYAFRDKIMGVVSETEVAYHDPKKKTVHRATAKDSRPASGDKHKLHVRAENHKQAKAKAEAASEAANREGTTVEGTTSGDVRLVAGINIDLKDFGKLSGAYHIKQSRHEAVRGGGYSVSFSGYKVVPING